MASLSKKINTLFAEGQWSEARRLLLEAAKKQPNDHWILARISTTYYEEKDYRQAHDFIARAGQIQPGCPLVLWTAANTLSMLGKYEQAIHTYDRILALGSDRIAYDECGEGLRWARSLLGDTIFRKADCLENMGQYDKAIKHYLLHLEQRMNDPDLLSIYPEDLVRQRIHRLAERHPELLREEAVQDQYRELELA